MPVAEHHQGLRGGEVEDAGGVACHHGLVHLDFAGAIGKELPSGVTREQVIEMARARGDEQIADLLAKFESRPSPVPAS